MSGIQKQQLVNINYKVINDIIHGNINISNLACMIIDTHEFQRLRKLRQLGMCNYVFPSAAHTRFEHSIGTYHLTEKMLNCIIRTTNREIINEYMIKIPELSKYYETKTNKKSALLDKYVCELIKIAGLCHDIGHGPFSHVFDNVFLPEVNLTSEMSEHENRSNKIIEHVIKNNSELCEIITNDEIEFIKNVIHPKTNNKGFVYQIVSNDVNGIDVDKFDYLQRDVKMVGNNNFFTCDRLMDSATIINENICYPVQCFHQILTMYEMRYNLHKQIYLHKAVLSIEFMMCELMILMDPILKISESIDDVLEFCKLSDNYILESINVIHNMKHIMKLTDENKNNYHKAQKIMKKIEERDIYKMICYHLNENNLEISKEKLLLCDNEIDIDNIIIHVTKVGIVSGDKTNPLDNISFYDTKLLSNQQELEEIKMNKKHISLLIPNVYQEYMHMIYIKNKIDDEQFLKIKNAFQKLTNV